MHIYGVNECKSSRFSGRGHGIGILCINSACMSANAAVREIKNPYATVLDMPTCRIQVIHDVYWSTEEHHRPCPSS